MRTKAKAIPRTRKPNQHRPPPAPDRGDIQQGTVGWEDGAEVFDVAPEGVPFVKVTLFAGYNTELQGLNTDPKRARGLPILARFSGRDDDIPQDGELVVVARPAGMETTIGSYCIISRPTADPKFIPNRKAGEKLIFGPGNNFLRLKENGDIFLFTRHTPDEQGKAVSLQVRPDGFSFVHPNMTITAGPDGYHAVHSSGARIDFGAVGGMPAPLDALSSILKLSAAMIQIEASGTAIGPNGGVPDTLLKATPSLAAIAAVQATLAAMATAITDLAATAAATAAALSPPNPAAVALAVTSTSAAGAAATASGASSVLVAALPTTAPTQALTGA